MNDTPLIDWTGRMRVRISTAELLQFSPEDSRCLFDLRNDPSVRAFMPDPAPLDFGAHCRWVASNLVGNPDFVMFIVRAQTQPVGFALLKRVDADALELGLMFIDRAQNQRLVVQVAVLMGKLAIDRWRSPFLVTYVRAVHEHGLALNDGMGLVRAETSDKAGEIRFRTPAEVIRAHAVYRRVSRSLDEQIDFICI